MSTNSTDMTTRRLDCSVAARCGVRLVGPFAELVEGQPTGLEVATKRGDRSVALGIGHPDAGAPLLFDRHPLRIPSLGLRVDGRRQPRSRDRRTVRVSLSTLRST